MRDKLADCRFCGLEAPSALRPFCDAALLATPDHTVVASLGAMTPGWLLLVPTEHRLNLAGAYSAKSLVALRQAVAEILLREFSSAVRLFEHGATSVGSQTGCGVNHAHIHMLPLAESLSGHLVRDGSYQWVPVKSSEIPRRTAGKEYLFYSDDPTSVDPHGLLAVVATPVSQFFRRVIARSLGVGDAFDYRIAPFQGNVLETQRRFVRYLGDVRLPEAV